MRFSIRNNTIIIDKSKIHGKGVFSNAFFREGDFLGIVIKKVKNTGNPDEDYFRTAMGRYINHSDEPNSRIIPHKNRFYGLKAIKDIPSQTEILVNYEEFAKVTGIPIKSNFKKGKMTFYLSKRAMDRLPIHADPILWTNEQLLESVSDPELMGQLKQRKVPPAMSGGPERALFEAVVEEINKRNIAKGLQLKDVGHWREQGLFLLYGVGMQLLGIYDNKSKADMARMKLIDMFAEGQEYFEINGTPEQRYWLTSNPKDGFKNLTSNRAADILVPEETLPSTAERDALDAKWKQCRALARKYVDSAIDELLTHPFYKEKRRRYAEDRTEVEKAPMELEEFLQPGSIPEGAVPTQENSEKARDSARRFNNSSKYMDKSAISQSKDYEDMGATDAKKEFVEDVAKTISKRVKADIDKKDQSKLTDDNYIKFNLSKRDK